MLRNLGPIRTAVLTGWAVDPNCRFRCQTDAAFPLSDHADFNELLELVKRVSPKQVFTLHGFAAEFAETLRHLGFDAQALSEEDQLALPLGATSPKPKIQGHEPETSVVSSRRSVAEDTQHAPSNTLESAQDNSPFITFATTCAAI